MNIVELKRVTKRYGNIVAVRELTFKVGKGQIVSLLGPSGCGKTTTLRLIAGFELTDEGQVFISGEDMHDKRPYERNVGLLFQDYALFPHMSVERNIAFGMRYRAVDPKLIPKRINELLELFSLSGFNKRRPSELSGGQQQRVALARALATNPEVILLDEPLSALDAKLRQELQVELKRILKSVGTTTIVVTHDQEEAMSLSDYIIVIEMGRIIQSGTADDIYAKPNSRFVAEFIGQSNWFRGQIGKEVSPAVKEFKTDVGILLFVANTPSHKSERYEVCLRPERLKISHRIEDNNKDLNGYINSIHGTVVDVAYLGPNINIMVELENKFNIIVVEKNIGQTVKKTGQKVTIVFKPNDCIVVPAEID